MLLSVCGARCSPWRERLRRSPTAAQLSPLLHPPPAAQGSLGQIFTALLLYREKPPGYDGTYYPEGLEKTPRPFAIVKANQLMVDTCDWLVCYVRHGASNSRNLLKYAQRREKKGLIKTTNIAEGMDTHL